MRSGLIGLTLLLPLAACAQLPETCPYTSETDSAVSAGCFYVEDDKLLVVQGWTGALSLPGGLVRRGESAQCAAYRETWEETGLLLKPGERIDGFKDSYFLYRCQRSGAETKVDPSDGLEVRRALFISPQEFQDFTWRFPGDTALTQHLLLNAIASGER